MSSIVIQGDTSGSITIQAPAISGSTVINLPTVTGAGGSFIVTDSSNNLSLSSNLTFTGTGNRITGDFSNATVASRVMLQTSTANSATSIYIIPNGSSTTSQFVASSNSDPTNASVFQIQANSTSSELRSGITGTGTYLPMTFYTGGSERARIDTSGNVGVGTNSPGVKLDVVGTMRANTSVVAGNTSYGITINQNTLTLAGANSNFIFTKPVPTISNASRFDFNTGSLNTGILAGPWWNGVHFSSQDGITNASAANEFPRTSHYYSYSTVTNPTDLNYNIITGNSTVPQHMTIGTATSANIKFLIANAEAMRIDYNNNVGIGTTSPTQKLDVVGSIKSSALTSGRVPYASTGGLLVDSANMAYDGTTLTLKSDTTVPTLSVLSNSGTPNLRLGSQGNSAVYWQIGRDNVTTGDFIFANQTSEKMRIDSSGNVMIGYTSTTIGAAANNFMVAGNVGIGTNSIFAGLHIMKAFGNQLRIHETNGTYFDIQAGGRFDIKNAAGTIILSIAQSGSPVGNSLNIDPLGNVMMGYTTTTSTVANSLLVAGNVGIGTNAPAYKLDMSVSVGASAIANVARFYADASASAEARIIFGTFANAINGAIGVQSDSATTGILKFYTSTSGVLSEKMRIDGASGTVGIGTASPSSLRVTIEGSGSQLRIRNTTTRYRSDYIVSNAGSTNINSYDDTGAAYTAINFDTSAFTVSTGISTNTERMRVDAPGNVMIGYTTTTSQANSSLLVAGNVGIGTNAPAYKLDIGSFSTSAAQTIRIASISNTELKLMETADTYGFTIRNVAASGLNIFRHSADATGTTALYIGRDTGLVGLGTNNPQAALHVYSGDIMVGNAASATSRMFRALEVGVAGNNAGISFGSNGAKGSIFGQSGTGGLWIIGSSNGGSQPLNFGYSANDTSFSANTVSLGAWGITGLGIGTNAPATRLYVSGSAASNNATLTDGATITPDFTQSNNFSVTLAGNRTMANPTGLTVGQSGVIFITQDATGSRTLAWGTSWDWANAGVPVLTTAANAIDVVAYTVRTATSIVAQIIQNIG